MGELLAAVVHMALAKKGKHAAGNASRKGKERTRVTKVKKLPRISGLPVHSGITKADDPFGLGAQSISGWQSPPFT